MKKRETVTASQPTAGDFSVGRLCVEVVLVEASCDEQRSIKCLQSESAEGRAGGMLLEDQGAHTAKMVICVQGVLL